MTVPENSTQDRHTHTLSLHWISTSCGEAVVTMAAVVLLSDMLPVTVTVTGETILTTPVDQVPALLPVVRSTFQGKCTRLHTLKVFYLQPTS